MAEAEPTEPHPFRAHHSAGQRLVLLRIADLSVLWLDAQVPEGQLQGLAVGDGHLQVAPGTNTGLVQDHSAVPVAQTQMLASRRALSLQK